jgi:hypothetical protein
MVKSMLLAAAMFLTACGLPKMTKPGVSDEQFAKDNYDCYRDNQTYPPGFTFTQHPIYLACMEARGYRRD